MHAARELGLEDEYAVLPVQHRFWLAKRKVLLDEIRHGKGTEEGGASRHSATPMKVASPKRSP